MLSIPEEIKQAIKEDSALVNVRVVFVNGEFPDITNEQIDSDSVTFTESICSGDSLSLGLMESPTFEFEACNIPNIKGKKINVFYEYYCDSSVQGAVYKADLSHYVYQLPIGLFTVSSSPKETDMDFRKVTAYASVIDESLTLRSDYISAMNVPWFNQKAPVRVHIDDLQRMNFFDPSIIDISKITTTRIESRSFTDGSSHYNLGITMTGYNIERDITNDADWEMRADITQVRKFFNYFKINCNWGQYNAKLQKLIDDVIDWIASDGGNEYEARELIPIALKDIANPTLFINEPITYIKETENYSGGAYTGGKLFGYYNNNDTDEIRHIDNEVIRSTIGCIFNALCWNYETISYTKDVWYHYETYNKAFIPLTIEIEITNTFTHDSTTVSCDCNSELTSVYTKEVKVDYILEEDTNLQRIDFNRSIGNKNEWKVLTLNSSYQPTGHTNKKRMDYSADIAEFEAVEIRDLMASMAELQGKLGRINRFGQFELVSLNGSSGLTPSNSLVPAETLYPGGANGGTVFPINYISCWYEDLKIEQFGQINLKYRDAENEGNEADFTFLIEGGGNKSYTIEGNSILENCVFTRDEIENMIEVMAANLKNIEYVPCEIEMLGRPELECGDFIQFMTQDGNALKTIIFRRTLKGTQLIMDSIEVNATDDASKSGSSSGGSSSSGSISGVSSVNGFTGDVALTMSDIPNNYFKYDYDSATKTVSILGLIERVDEDD